MKSLLILAIFAVFTSGQENICSKPTHLCIKDYCDTCFAGKCGATTPPPAPEDVVYLKMFETPEDYCDCCQPVLVPTIGEGDACFNQISGYELQSKGVCASGLYCSQKESGQGDYACQRKQTVCHQEQDSYDHKLLIGELGMNEDRPECDGEGYYEPLQCIFSGVCRCVEKETGFPIFGFSLNVQEAAAKNVDCSCGRYISQLKQMSCPMEVDYNGNTERSNAEYIEELNMCEHKDDFYFQDALRCDSHGDYDTAQCISRFIQGEDGDGLPGEICFCINKNTANITTNACFIDDAPFLCKECHEITEEHPAGYYRPCQVELKMKLERPSGNYTGYATNEWLPVCGPDGHYALIQHHQTDITKGYCSDYKNHQIENFSGVYKDMDCLCAQVRNAMLPTDDRPECDEKGSFQPKQCRGERCYCVNEHGKQTTLEQTSLDEEICKQNYFVQ